MKKIAIIIFLFSNILLKAQDTLYVYKSGEIISTIATSNIDSLTFEDTPASYITDAEDFDTTKLISIEKLLTLYAIASSGSINKIDSNYFVKGIITANDSSGNIYKTFYVQDETRAIEIPLNKNSVYKKFPIGQTVYLRCKNLYIYNYYGIFDLEELMILAGKFITLKIPAACGKWDF